MLTTYIFGRDNRQEFTIGLASGPIEKRTSAVFHHLQEWPRWAENKTPKIDGVKPTIQAKDLKYLIAFLSVGINSCNGLAWAPWTFYGFYGLLDIPLLIAVSKFTN